LIVSNYQLLTINYQLIAPSVFFIKNIKNHYFSVVYEIILSLSKNKHNMKNIISVALWMSLVLSVGVGCKNKKPNNSVDSNTIETPPPPPPVESKSSDNNISLVEADTINKSKVKEGAKADKPNLADKAKKVESKPSKTEKAKTAATTKIPIPSKAPASTKVPVKSGKPMSKPLSTADKFPDEKVIKRNGRDDVLKIAEAAPAYNGGEKAMKKFLQNNIKYPSKAKDDGVQGTVFVRFVVEKDGIVDDVVVSKGVHPLLDAEAKRVVSVMPKWTPGKQNGKVVAVQYTLPVRFQLLD
jgi:TonB family protein